MNFFTVKIRVGWSYRNDEGKKRGESPFRPFVIIYDRINGWSKTGMKRSKAFIIKIV